MLLAIVLLFTLLSTVLASAVLLLVLVLVVLLFMLLCCPLCWCCHASVHIATVPIATGCMAFIVLLLALASVAWCLHRHPLCCRL